MKDILKVSNRNVEHDPSYEDGPTGPSSRGSSASLAGSQEEREWNMVRQVEVRR